MSDISIPDYLKMRKILDYLSSIKREKLQDNDNFTNSEIMYLTELIEGLQGIVNKLERE